MKRLFEKASHVNHRKILSEERFSAANPELSRDTNFQFTGTGSLLAVWLLYHSLSWNSHFLLAPHILACVIRVTEKSFMSWNERLLYQLTVQCWKKPAFESYQWMTVVFQTVMRNNTSIFPCFLSHFLYFYVFYIYIYMYLYICMFRFPSTLGVFCKDKYCFRFCFCDSFHGRSGKLHKT